MDEKEFKAQSMRNCFNLKDSGLNFIYSLIFPFLVSFVLAIIFFIFKLDGTQFEKVVNMAFVPGTFFLIYFLYCRKNNINMIYASQVRLKINWLKALTVVVIAVTAVFLVSPMISLIDHLFTFVGYNPKNDLPYEMTNVLTFIIGIITMAVLPAICEELLFRGLILKGVQTKFGPHVSILISAAMFTLLHGSLQQTVYQFILGTLLGYAMYYGKSIIYPILLHFINNLVVVITSFIYTLKGIDPNQVSIYTTLWDYVSPIMWFVIAGCIIIGLIYVLQYLDKLQTSDELKAAVKELAEEAKNTPDEVKLTKKGKNKEIIASESNIIDSETTGWTKEEKIIFFGSIGLSIFFWITNTLMQFLGF
ncbi:MAG: CPBP family intramembrane metalloprotease [Clostridia bacterium]|nr:CPBP family intramembrane metalloprotease [Clostridia bacterium]